MKSILCCAILFLPTAHGASRKPSGKSATNVPPKARVVVIHPTRKKVLVSAAAVSPEKQAEAAVPKVVAARAIPSYQWRLSPRFQKTGKEDTTWGFMLRRPF